MTFELGVMFFRVDEVFKFVIYIVDYGFWLVMDYVRTSMYISISCLNRYAYIIRKLVQCTFHNIFQIFRMKENYK